MFDIGGLAPFDPIFLIIILLVAFVILGALAWDEPARKGADARYYKMKEEIYQAKLRAQGKVDSLPEQ